MFYIDSFRGFYITARGCDEGYDRPDIAPLVAGASIANGRPVQHKVG